MKHNLLRFLILFAMFNSSAFFWSSLKAQNFFVKKEKNNFTINNKPYYFIGANMWYANFLAMENTKGGNRKRLIKELNFLKQNGVNNIRVLIGAQGEGKMINGVYPVHPAIQPAPDKFNDDILDGMDFLIQQLQKRKMYGVFYFGNNWEWSGGFLQYLNWHNHLSDSVLATKYSWDNYRDFVSRFYSCADCMKDYWNFINHILQRTNKLTGKKYTGEPSIMAWEIANEPRPMRTSAAKEYKDFLKKSTALIKQKDHNHLVTLGTEGYMGTETIDIYQQIHEDINVDYATIHIWPKNWGWYNDNTFKNDFNTVVNKTTSYINEHEVVMQKINKPLVIEEFGLPRDNFSFSMQSSVTYRNNYFETILQSLVKSKKNNSVIAGINFWTFSGFGKPAKNVTPFWKEGDDLLGDPPMEEQGLNSVFAGDTSTWNLISEYVNQLKK